MFCLNLEKEKKPFEEIEGKRVLLIEKEIEISENLDHVGDGFFVEIKEDEGNPAVLNLMKLDEEKMELVKAEGRNN